MDNSPNWDPQAQPAGLEGQALPGQPQQQYGQQAWQAPGSNYAPPQYGQQAWQAPGSNYMASTPPLYAQAQPQQQQANNFLMRWLMMGIAVRIVLLIVVPLLLCGGCALVALISSLGR